MYFHQYEFYVLKNLLPVDGLIVVAVECFLLFVVVVLVVILVVVLVADNVREKYMIIKKDYV